MRLHPGAILACMVASFGCEGVIVDARQNQPSGPGPLPSASQCKALSPSVGLSAIRRLTRQQYDNTVADLFGDTTSAATRFHSDTAAGGYFANVDTPVDAVQTEDYLHAAEDVATRYVSTLDDASLGCSMADSACVRPWLTELTRRAFRRPALPQIVDGLVTLYESGRSAWDAQTGVRLAVEAILVSPHFLYLVELEPAEGAGEVVPLDDFELATRMSYFLWNTTPDDELLQAAETGALQSPEGLAEQARRMVADRRHTAATLHSFYSQWLGLDEPTATEKDPASFPSFDPSTAEAMRYETMRFIDEVYFQDDARLSTLLTASYGFVNEQLAPLFGVNASGPELTRVELDPKQRAGLLTRPRFLSAHAHQADVSWVSRGLFVRRQMLCQTLAPPPADVSMDTTLDPNRVTDPQCASCHQLMDPIGQGFDHYDALGQYRTTYSSGEPVNATGEVVDRGDGLGFGFEGAVALAHELASRPEVETCMARNWMRYAIARVEGPEDGCSIVDVQQALQESGGDLNALLVGVVTSDAFRYRRRSAP